MTQHKHMQTTCLEKKFT